MVGGRLVGGSVESVGRWLVDLIKPRKNMFGVVISPVHFVGGFFVILILFFSILTIKKKQIRFPEAVYSRDYWNFIKYFLYL